MTIQTVPIPICPDCEEDEIETPMVLRHRRSDGKPFWGCSKFPKCRGTRNINPDGTPETNEDIEEREQESDEYDYFAYAPWGHGIDGWGDF